MIFPTLAFLHQSKDWERNEFAEILGVEIFASLYRLLPPPIYRIFEGI
jgi:hypothetical protein